MSETSTLLQRRHPLYAATAIFTAALLVRWRASLGEFWLDEAWSWFLVQVNVRRAADIVLTLKHDNNHMLNSWFIYILGPERDWTTYRLPAVLFGTATVALAGWWGSWQGKSVGWFAMLLTAGSYVLTHYSSEARGYAPLMFFSLLAFAAMERSLTTRRAKWDVLWNVAAVLGVLSHPTFATVLFSAAIWSAVYVVIHASSKRDAALRMLRWHLVPAVFCGWIYWVNLGQMAIGGGLEQSPGSVVREALSVTIGGPFAGAGSNVAASVVALALVACFVWLAVSGRSLRALLYLLLIAGAPAALVMIAERSDLYVRYFLVSILFALLVFSLALGRMLQAKGRWRVLAACLTITYLGANAVHIARLWADGRGHYLPVLEQMQQQTRRDEVVIGSDGDFRHRLMLTFYQRYVTMDRPMVLLDGSPTSQPPEWLLLHRFEPDWQPESSIASASGAPYQLVQAYPYAGLSGWSLALYRRADD